MNRSPGLRTRELRWSAHGSAATVRFFKTKGRGATGKEAEQRVLMPSWELAVGDSVELALGAPDNGCLGLGEVGNVCTVADE